MQWLSQNWIWVLVLVGFVAMHLFGHGGHGGGGCGGAHQHARQKDKPLDDRPTRHQH